MEVFILQKELILDAITCSECTKIPKDSSNQVLMCPNGHIYCITCVPKSSKEKKCRRNTCNEVLKKTVEPILADIFDNCYFNCENRLCPAAILGRDLADHRYFCHYAPIPCPDCGTVVDFQLYLNHLDKKHSVPVNSLTQRDWVQYVTVEFPPREDSGYNISHFHSFQRQAFFVHFIVKPKDIFIWIQYYGAETQEQDYNVTICLSNAAGHKTEITVPVNSIRENFTRARDRQYYAHFSKDLIRCYLVALISPNFSNYYGPPNSNRTSIMSAATTGSTGTTTSKISSSRQNSTLSRTSSLLSTRSSLASPDMEMFPGALNFRIEYKHHYWKTFNKNVGCYEMQNGIDSSC